MNAGFEANVGTDPGRPTCTLTLALDWQNSKKKACPDLFTCWFFIWIINILYIYRAVSSVKLVYFLWENWKREPKPWQVLNQHPRCSTMQQNSRSVRIDDGDIWMTSMKAVKFHLQHHAIPWDLHFFFGGGSHITLLKTKINLGKGWRPSEIWMLLKLFFQVLNIQISLAVPRFCLPGIPATCGFPTCTCATWTCRFFLTVRTLPIST